MSNILTNELCNKCGAETLTEEYYLDGYAMHCSTCGYSKEDFLTEEECDKYILSESNNKEEI